MTTLPESPAVIDWSYYKSAVAKAGMVDDFEKKVSSCLSKTRISIIVSTKYRSTCSMILTNDCH